jgi:CubicO group peptidase (beta-lactamase class C family)
MKNPIRLLTLLMLAFVLSITSSAQTKSLIRVTPESQGVSSKYIIDYLNAIDTGNVEMHSFMLIRHGNVVAEGWWSPFGADYKHIMYSASKTFTATAIGLAVNEKRLKLTDKVISFFPASVPDTLSNYMKELTVRDMLMMSTGQDQEPRRGQNDDWIRSFLSKAPTDKPGTIFRYNNTATFMLSSIVQQVTGETVFNYLMPRIFKPLGMRGIDWDLNPQGINLGMIGLRLRTEDMARFGLLLSQQGKWEGKQLIPKAWIAEATSYKIASRGGNERIPAEINDWFQGYCYQMWRGRHNTVRLDGMAGQFVILIPDYDAIVILTANASNTQKEMNYVWDYLLPAMSSNKPLPENPALNSELKKKIASLTLPVAKSGSSSLMQRISGKAISFQDNNYNIKEARITFSDGQCLVALRRDAETVAIKAGADSWKYANTSATSILSAPRAPASKSRDANYTILQPVIKVAANYSWTDNNTLELNARFVEEALATESVVFKFEDKDGVLNVTLDRKNARGGMPGPGGPGGPGGMMRAPAPLTGKLIEN